MSTKERYGAVVWNAISDLTDHNLGNEHRWVSVGQVANKAGVSIPTAKKYLMKLWEMGYVMYAKIDGVSGFRAKKGMI